MEPQERTALSREQEREKVPDVFSDLISAAIRLELRSLEAQDLLQEWVRWAQAFSPSSLTSSERILVGRTTAWLERRPM